jgi:hypothetical protein
MHLRKCIKFSYETTGFACGYVLVLPECETWSLTLKEEHRLRMFQNRFPRSIFGPKKDEVTGVSRNRIMRSSITCTLRQV